MDEYEKLPRVLERSGDESERMREGSERMQKADWRRVCSASLIGQSVGLRFRDWSFTVWGEAVSVKKISVRGIRVHTTRTFCGGDHGGRGWSVLPSSVRLQENEQSRCIRISIGITVASPFFIMSEIKTRNKPERKNNCAKKRELQFVRCILV